IYPILLRLGIQVTLKLNQKYFTVKIICNLQNPNIPGFIYKGERVNSRVLSNSFNAINTTYKKAFGQNKTKYPEATLLGFYDSYII
ncbi:4985_t:CDS:1, partial [Funneliformis geosporum]